MTARTRSVRAATRTAALLICVIACQATIASPVTQPGESMGLAPGYPLPEGYYLLDTFSVGRADAANAPNVLVNIPFVVWASPYKLFGGRIQPIVSVPTVGLNTRFPAPIPNSDPTILFNPSVGSAIAWDLGGSLGVSYYAGGYLPFGDRGSFGIGAAGTPILPQTASATFRQTFAATYICEGNCNLSLSLTHNLTLDPRARYGGAVGAALGPIPQSDSVNLDVTATRRFGALEAGLVAFAYSDLPVRRTDPLYANYRLQGVVGLGGLVGYDFGRFALQLYATRQILARDSMTVNGLRQRNEETRGWMRVSVPIPGGPGAPPDADAPLR